MGEFDSLVGELTPGQVGYLPISDDGFPTGEPATANPPDMDDDISVASVMCNPAVPLPEGEDLLLTASGGPLVAPLQPIPDPRDPDIQKEPIEPVISALSPNTAIIGAEDVEMSVIGTGFTKESVIIFNHGEELTDYVSDTELTTGVRPSLVSMPISVPVMVRNGRYESNEMPFEFTVEEPPPDPEVEGSEDQHRRK